jgi:hypothetical protein
VRVQTGRGGKSCANVGGFPGRHRDTPAPRSTTSLPGVRRSATPPPLPAIRPAVGSSSRRLPSHGPGRFIEARLPARAGTAHAAAVVDEDEELAAPVRAEAAAILAKADEAPKAHGLRTRSPASSAPRLRRSFRSRPARTCYSRWKSGSSSLRSNRQPMCRRSKCSAVCAGLEDVPGFRWVAQAATRAGGISLDRLRVAVPCATSCASTRGWPIALIPMANDLVQYVVATGTRVAPSGGCVIMDRAAESTWSY